MVVAQLKTSLDLILNLIGYGSKTKTQQQIIEQLIVAGENKKLFIYLGTTAKMKVVMVRLV